MLSEGALDYLIKIKTQLSDNNLTSGSLVSDLYGVAILAESFTAQRPKSNKNWVPLADELDREGSHSERIHSAGSMLSAHTSH